MDLAFDPAGQEGCDAASALSSWSGTRGSMVEVGRRAEPGEGRRRA